MTEHYDDLETRDPAAREASQFEFLRAQIRDAKARAPGMAAHLSGVDGDQVTDRAALASLPVLRKTALSEMQTAAPPFGGLTTRPASGIDYMFQSPGPIYEPGMATPDWWRFGRAIRPFQRELILTAGNVCKPARTKHCVIQRVERA